MCGIFVAISTGRRGVRPDCASAVARALGAIRHRGPDASGIAVDPAGRFALGHVRLSVIDVTEESNQPFWSACGRWAIVFNGEIYNYVELRAELEALGVRFRTRSDTEVLLAAVVRWGADALPRLNGMFAFAVVDTVDGSVLVARDRWGVKPLYVARDGDELLLCSEAKGIFAYLDSVPRPNQASIGLFLRFGVSGESAESFYEGIGRFPTASSRTFRLGEPAPSSVVEYWSYPASRTLADEREEGECMLSMITDAVRIRLRSDVPVGLSLSGGVDSAVIAWIAGSALGTKLEAFTAYHEPAERSELPRARQVADAFGHRLRPVLQGGTESTIDDLRLCLHHLDGAHASPAIVPYLRLCKAARSELTVMLEGQGADELYAGYTQFLVFAAMDELSRGNVIGASRDLGFAARHDGWSSVTQDLVRFLVPAVYRRQAHRWGASALLGKVALEADPGPQRRIRLGRRDNLDEALFFWHRNNLTNLLQYGDAVSMSVNLETRCPFVDYRLVERGFRLADRFLVRDGYGKWLLRSVASGAIPPEIVWRRRKDGFTNPTMGLIRRHVLADGWPARGLGLALEAGILTPAIRGREAIERLTENATFRIFSVMTWLEQAYVFRGGPA